MKEKIRLGSPPASPARSRKYVVDWRAPWKQLKRCMYTEMKSWINSPFSLTGVSGDASRHADSRGRREYQYKGTRKGTHKHHQDPSMPSLVISQPTTLKMKKKLGFRDEAWTALERHLPSCLSQGSFHMSSAATEMAGGAPEHVLVSQPAF